MISKVKLWWWRRKPQPRYEEGFEKLVEWCRKGERYYRIKENRECKQEKK